MEESKEVTKSKGGRPAGSKNQITLLKLALEESFRERNERRIQEVLDIIVEQALDGDKPSQKLIWQSVISGASVDEKAHAKDKVVININSEKSEKEVENVLDGEYTQEEEEDGEQ